MRSWRRHRVPFIEQGASLTRRTGHAYTPGELAAHCSGAVLIPQPTNDGCATIPIRPRSGTVSILTGFLRRNMPAIGLSLLFSLVARD